MTPNWSGLTTAEITARFWSKVALASPDECWVWTRAVDHRGYGRFKASGVHFGSHRFAYLASFGEIGEGICVCHRCDNPPCCNPAHLFLGTHADNARDKIEKGRGSGPSGEINRHARLSSEQVLEMRSMRSDGAKYRQLAEAFGVTEAYAWDICAGRRWGHLTTDSGRAEQAPANAA